jgi:hypothetical protein
MKNEIQLLNINDVMSTAKIFAESGMFTDSKQMAQAFVKIQAGQEMGIGAFASMTGINIIMGKPTISAGLIASAVKGSGKYDYKVKEMNDKACSIDFYQGKEFIGNSTFTLEDAKKQSTKNLDKFPKNMLFARAISNGQKWFCPDIFQISVYVPEEMPEQTENIEHVEVLQEKEVEQTKEIPTLSDAQLQKTLNSTKATMTKALTAISNGSVIATEFQILAIENKLKELETIN